MNPNHFNVATCDATGKHFVRLLEATEKVEYMQPSISPDGKQIVFSRCPNGYPGGRHIWLSNIDGSNAHVLPNPDDKSNTHGGDYPSWSPDGKKIYFLGISSFIISIDTAKELIARNPQQTVVCGWPHWGRLGLIGYNVGGILFTDSDLKSGKWLASSGLVNCSDRKSVDCKW